MVRDRHDVRAATAAGVSGAVATSQGAPETRQLGRRAASLVVANTFDYGIQFLLPIVLVRCLDPVEFGHYRMVWLVMGTVMGVVTTSLPTSLYYFLPRSNSERRRLYINQTLLVHLLAGMVAALAVSGLNPWLPSRLVLTGPAGWIIPAFVLLWIVASTLDVLPTVEERVSFQTRAGISLSLLRVVLLSLVAFIWRDLEPVLIALVIVAAFRVGTLLGYIAVHHGLRGPWLRHESLVEQLRFVSPFWASGSLYNLRVQADQWVAATLFSLSSYAAFSVAAVIASLVMPIRHAINFAFLPTMSRSEADGDVRTMIDLNARANLLAGVIIFPAFAFIFAFAEDVITIVYTANYLAAAPVMRIFIFGLTPMVIELASVTLILKQGPFTVRLNFATLVGSVATNWAAAHACGLPGAAIGTAAGMWADRYLTLRRVRFATGIPWRSLQDWRGLVQLFGAAVSGAVLAWAVVNVEWPHAAPLLRVATGAAVMGLGYLAVLAVLGRGRVGALLTTDARRSRGGTADR